MAALDATKAFDRVNHIKLFHRMYNICVPIHVIKLVMNWYAKIVSVSKMGEMLLSTLYYEKWCETGWCVVANFV